MANWYLLIHRKVRVYQEGLFVVIVTVDVMCLNAFVIP